MTRPQSGSTQSHQETSIRQQGQAQLNHDPRDATATGHLTLTRRKPPVICEVRQGGSAAPSLAQRVSLALPSRCGACPAIHKPYTCCCQIRQYRSSENEPKSNNRTKWSNVLIFVVFLHFFEYSNCREPQQVGIKNDSKIRI